MIPAAWRAGEVAVVGLGKSGVAASLLLAREHMRVYASDAGTGARLDAAGGALRARGVAVDLGAHDVERIARASIVVASPGVPPDAPPLARARRSGVPIVSELEIGLRMLRDTRVIAITGTNGKTTTTALIGHLLRILGHDAVDAGNIGVPVSEIALREHPPEWLALEVSSFQLHDTPGIDPDVGVLTNLSPDHLDRYASVEDYYADKALLFRNATAGSKWVVNYDDVRVMRMIARVPGEHRYFGTLPPHGITAADMYFTTAPAHGSPEARLGSDASPAIFWHGERLLSRDELQLLGDHNVMNAMAAALAVLVADAAHQTPESRMRIAGGLRSFHALPHRLETVGEFASVLWINDSKATNVSSARVAIEGMTKPTIVLLGGRHKGEPYTALLEPLRRHAKAVIAYGEAAPTIVRDLAGVRGLEQMGSDFTAVVERARSLAAPGDAVLLSPACSSYDMFTNYEQRGETFRRLAGER